MQAVNDETFASVVGDSDIMVLVDFTATWCGPCKALAPILSRIETSHTGRVLVVKVDVDQSPETAARFGIRSVPTMILTRGGKEVHRITGLVPESRIVLAIASYLG